MDPLGSSAGQGWTGEARAVGDARDSSGMSDGEADEHEPVSGEPDRPSSVLWERVIQQSIFVDISEDESLHFSDLQGSFSVHLSENSAQESSIHLSGNTGRSGTSEDTHDEGSASESSVFDNSHRKQGGGAESSGTRVSMQRPNTMEASPLHRYDEEAGDTSDEDQEDLPYDGDLGSHCPDPPPSRESCDAIGQGAREADFEDEPVAQAPEMNSGSGSQHTIYAPLLPSVGGQVSEMKRYLTGGVQSTDPRTVVLGGIEGGTELAGHTRPGEACVGQSRTHADAPHSNIRDLLLQHFSQDELLNASLYIEAETMPEVSFIDSTEETTLSKAPISLKCSNFSMEGTLNESGRSQASKLTASESKHPQETKESQKSEGSPHTGSDIPESHEEESAKCSRASSPEPADAVIQLQSPALGRTRSCNELKYGQGQVHYPLPDFSKVAPKVRIPKANAVKPVNHPPGMHRVQSSPGMLGKTPTSCKATVDLISKVLEDSIQISEIPYVFSDQPKQQENPPKTPELVQHLQAEYDKLLTKYAEAENLIDQMRLGAKAQPPGESGVLEGADLLDARGAASNTDALDQPPSHRGVPEGLEDSDSDSRPTQTDEKQLSEGEKMTTELMEIINQFVQKVEDFKDCLISMSIGINEQQMVFKSLMDAQDQLERNYIAKKEEHRALEMQNYMGLARNTGEFDPERQVEGEIFRIGMRLEDIKELIDRNVCDRLSPPASASTPTPVPPQTRPVVSTAPPQREEPAPCFSRSDSGTEESMAASPLGGASVLQSCDVAPAESPRGCTGQTSHSVQCSDASLERFEFTGNEEEEEEGHPAVGAAHGGIRESSPNVTTPDPQGKPESVWNHGQSEVAVCQDRGGDVSHARVTKTQGPSAEAESTSQRIVTPETDSGFGSLDLSLLAAGRSWSNPETERSNLYLDQYSTPPSMSGSDSEASRSDVQTATVRTAWSRKQSEALQRAEQSVAHSMEGVNSELPGGDSHTTTLPCHPGSGNCLAPPPQTSSLPRDWAHGDTPPANSHICSCHNEAISTLQLEVSRLKKELEESLFHLPHLTKRMDYLASRYKQERRHKPWPRAHVKPASTSGGRRSGGRPRKLALMDADSVLFKVEDWISSDMEPTTDSGESPRSVRLGQSDALSASRENGGSCSRSDGRGTSRVARNLSTDEDYLPQCLHQPHSRAEGRHSPEVCYNSLSYPLPNEEVEPTHSKGSHFTHYAKPMQKPLLQVNYGSSYSLPAGFKAMEQQSTSHHRGRSTQSDSALLPSNVYFQRSRPPARAPSRTGSVSKYKRNEEEDISRTLDRAIEAAQSMKRTTDRMAQSLSADLAKAELRRKLHGLHPRQRRENNDS